ncbi:hypothetical protein [Pyruvatibacter sp.]|uniref:hypothetical protein n=1 Tax=Pyruvatibacter sp. TaxID=1981328 RepID=UPI0032EF0F0C
MKRFLLVAAAILTGLGVFAGLAVTPAHAALDGCTYQGLPLRGEVTIVPNNATLTVEIVDSNPDLKVEWIDRHSNACGHWRKVGLGADFTIQIVPSGGDIRIQEVTSGAGLP